MDRNLLTPGIIRTAVPALVGWLITVLAERWQIIITDGTRAEMVAAFTAIATVAYYVLIRVLSKEYPWLEKLLGSDNQPLYRQKKTR